MFPTVIQLQDARRRTHRYAGLALVFLCGCAAGPAVQDSEGVGWGSARAHLLRIEAFDLRGRAAVAAEPEGFNGRVGWQQDDERFDVALRGPLGVGGASLVGDAAGVTITRNDGSTVFVDDPRAALETELGWSFPVAALRHWLVGVPHPQSKALETLNDAGTRLARLEQDGWQIEYATYQQIGDWVLPRKITLRHPGVRIRLIADEWEILRARQ